MYASNSSSARFLTVSALPGNPNAVWTVVLDPVTGDLADTMTRYLESHPVKLFQFMTQNHEAVLAVSSTTWLSYYFQNRFHLALLSYDSLEFASGFASEQCPEGIVAIASNTLRILALEKLGAVFNQVSYPLEYTPRRSSRLGTHSGYRNRSQCLHGR